MLLPVLFSNYFIFKLLFHFLFLVLPRNNVINMNKVLYNTLISKGLPPPSACLSGLYIISQAA